MENYLESAGKSLKIAASELSTVMYISLGTTAILIITSLVTILTIMERLVVFGTVGILSSMLILTHYFSMVKNLRDSGNNLIMMSNRIEIKSSVKVPDSASK